MSDKSFKENMKAVAKKYGGEVEFDSKNPGVINTSTGKRYSWEEVYDIIMKYLGED